MNSLWSTLRAFTPLRFQFLVLMGLRARLDIEEKQERKQNEKKKQS